MSATATASGLGFDEAHLIHDLKHYLPSQSALKDFIHHNSLHAYQHKRFYEAIFEASGIFGYQVTLQLGEFRQLYRNGRISEDVLRRIVSAQKGPENLSYWLEKLLSSQYDECRQPRIGHLRKHWKQGFGLDMDSLVQPLLFRVLSGYLDQGIAVVPFPVDAGSFLPSLKVLETNGLVSFFKTKQAKNLLIGGELDMAQLLKMVVGDEAYFEQYLFDQQFSHHGWSGIAAAVEEHPEGFLDYRKISLRELIVFELLLEFDTLTYYFGEGFEPLCSRVNTPPMSLFEAVPSSELHEVLALWQDAFEWSYYDGVLSGIVQSKLGFGDQLTSIDERLANIGSIASAINVPKTPKTPSFQAVFCIDERECSLRRHIEYIDKDCETLGAPGFFGIEFFFQPEGGKFYEKLCPAPVTPKYLIKEFGAKNARPHDAFYTKRTHGLLSGFITSLTFGFWAGLRLVQNLFSPKMLPAISNAFGHADAEAQLTIENKDINDRENDLQVGFTLNEMANRIEAQLRNMGLLQHFAPIVYVFAHGSSSANNPHHGAHDCGACSGRPGATNARVFAFMANHTEVRAILAQRGIKIPASTQFLGGMHDTAADEIGYFDERVLSPENTTLHQRHKQTFENALDLNAKERSRRFASISTVQPIKNIRRAIKDRSVSLFEPRPELGHGTNSLCIVGRRDMTRGLFLDRRAFLNSYDCTSDPEGKLLLGVMRPLGIVCGGINLEYYFSRVDNHMFGAGTKLPHNVVGLFGVANSTDGDLRPGLPLQMIEVHDPVRLMLIVEHFPEVVLKTVQSDPALYEWFKNDWIHLIAVHPETMQLHRFKNGHFEPYQPSANKIKKLGDFNNLVEKSIKMETNQIADATKENLPVFILN